MFQVVGFFGVPERAQARDHHLLRIRLPRIDHVEHFMRVAERGRAGIVRFRIGGPDFVAVGMRVEAAVVKIAAEQAEFPEMVRDVFADVGDRAGRAHDDFRFRQLPSGSSVLPRALRPPGRFLVRRKLPSPSSRHFCRTWQAESRRAASAFRTRRPRISGAGFRFRARASRNRCPAGRACADGSARWRSRRLPPSAPLRRGPLRCLSAFASAVRAAICLPRAIASRGA